MLLHVQQTMDLRLRRGHNIQTGGDTDMKYPDPEEFREFFRRLPRWVIPLIIVMLFGRFVLTLLFRILSQ